MTEHDELLPVFIEESQQHLQNIEPDLLALEKSGKETEPEMVNRIFRGIHSIKGAAGFFGFHNIGRLSHIMENSLSLLRDGKIDPTPELIDALLTGIDALKAMLDDAVASEEYDINHEVGLLQKFVDNADAPKKVVTVAEKVSYQTDSSHSHSGVLEQGGTEEPQAPAKFDISEEDVRYFVSNSLYLYAIKIFLDKDLRQKGKSPYEFINNMESMGQYVDSFLDIRSVTGLSDCLENDLAFDFLFATVLEPDEVTEGLGLSKERIRLIDLDNFKETAKTLEVSEPPEDTVKTSELSEPPEDTVKTSELSEPPEDTVKTSELSESHEDTVKTSELSESPEETVKTSELSEPSKKTSELSESEDDPEPAQKTVAARPIQTEEKIRVGVSFLNDLVNLAGELVLGRNQLIQVALPLVKNTPGLNPVLQHISRVTSEMQEKIMQMRMQPISLVFDKFHRVVRSLAKNHDKEVRLITFGGDVELDKSIIEGLSDPLTHLIRNAVDHGIEPPEQREKARKPRYGTIELRAYHQGGQVHLIISDDGKGVDGNFIAKKAIEKGLITQSQMNEMDNKDRVRLIFRPGFSTAEQVTDMSGRGVGMDVVITNIEHLGGTVDIETKPGKGMRVKLILPLTLAIISGLLIKAGELYFVLPEADIDELVRIKPNEINRRINRIQDARVLRLRETLLPLVDLNEVLGLKKAAPTRLENSDALNHEMNQKPLRILVVKHGASRFGLIVDNIVSTEEIVVKPLPRYLKKMKSFSGVSILGNGKVSLILDVSGILKKAAIRHIEDAKDELSQESEKSKVETEIQTLLLFDNNTPERFAIPLELISRIERIPASEIEIVKERQFLQYHDKKLRLIFLEDYLPITRPERTASDTIGIIVPKQIRHPMGIVFHQVINTIQTSVELDTTTIMSPGLFGSAVFEGKITLLPDMYRMFEMAAPEWYTTNQQKTGKGGKKQKYRILLTEDTPFFRMVESEYLTSAGYEVIQADNGKKAMQILEEQAVDAVILDIVMPEMDGWDVIRTIRADKRLKHLPVIAVTSLGDNELAQRGFKEGFDEWELKLDKTRLLEKLAALLN